MRYMWLVCLLGSFTSRIAAQDPSSAIPLPLLEYRVSGEGFWLDGNTSRLIAGGRGRVSLTLEGPYRFVFRPSYFFGRVNGRITDREARLEGLGYVFPDGFQDRMWYGFALGIYTHSRLRQVEARWQGGVGFGTRLLHEESRHLAMSLAVLSERTTFATGEIRRPIRGSLRLEAFIQPTGEYLRLGIESFLKPAFSDWSDLIWLTLFTLDVSLSERFAIGMALDNTYEAVVPGSLRPNDVRLTFGFTFRS